MNPIPKGYNTTHRRRAEAGRCVGCGAEKLHTLRFCFPCASAKAEEARLAYKARTQTKAA